MKLVKIGIAMVVLSAASVATLSARDDKDKERRAAPAQERPARHEAAPSRPAPAQTRNAPARQERPASAQPSRQQSSPSSPNPSNPPVRQDRSPAYNPPSRQEASPSYNPPAGQDRNRGSNPPARQEASPNYSPQNNRPSNTYPNAVPQANQPGASQPGRSGGWRQVDRNEQNGAPSRGNSGTIGSQRSNSPALQRQPAGADARRPQAAGGGSYRLPPGQTNRNSDGSTTHVATDGRTIHMDPRGRVTTVDVKGGGQVHYAPSGRPDRIVTQSGAVVMNRPGGVRQIVVQRPNQVMIVTNQRGHGYVQRPFEVRGHQYYQRTYYVGGRPYVNVYRPYYYHGAYYPYYVPTRYYRPAYYGWAYSPWSRPVVFSWGWGGAPWYGYYGSYFAPYPVYRSPLFWLTDFLFAETLQAAYDQRMADNAAAAREANYEAQEAMRPEVKQMVADEVQRQLAAERADSQNGGGAIQDAPRDTLPGIFNDGASHALVVHNPLQVDDGAQGCALTEGDVIGFEGNLTPGVETASARVLASHGRGCAAGTTVTIGLQDILDMQNNLRETIDRGLGELQTKAGTGGLPAPPAQAMGAPTPSPLASAAQADPNAATELSQQAQEATQGAQEILKEAPPLESGGGMDNSSDAQPPTVSLGMTTNQVQSLLGTPKRVVDLGPKKMFVYDDMKVIFMDGRVSDVQ